MRIGNRIISVRKVSEPTQEQIVAKALEYIMAKANADLMDPHSDLRQMVARVVRGESRSALDAMLENESDIREKAAVYAGQIFRGEFDWTEGPDDTQIPKVRTS